MGVHEDLIQALLDGFAQTQAEFAAANEIRALRARIVELEAAQAEKKVPVSTETHPKRAKAE